MSAISYRSLRADAARSAVASDIVIAGAVGYLFGVLPIDLGDDEAALAEYIEEQTRRVLDNAVAILAGSGLGRDDILAVTLYMRDYDRLKARMERGYAGFFAPGRLPTRSCVGVQTLPREALVQMDFIVRAAAG